MVALAVEPIGRALVRPRTLTPRGVRPEVPQQRPAPKYVAEQLIEMGEPKAEILRVVDEDGTESVMSDKELDDMHSRDVKDTDGIKDWVDFFGRYGVYFSAPLDLDFMMYLGFPTNYQATGGRGPRIPKSDEAVKEAVTAVLKQGTDGGTYTDAQRAAFPWYRYLFLGRGKPTTHILALTCISDQDLVANCL